jgi:hypothetical protein
VPSIQSYTITLRNNQTESSARRLLAELSPDFIVPSRDGVQQILKILGLSRSFSRAFDIIHVPNRDRSRSDEAIIAEDKFVLIELKTTRKRLPNNPYGFFFGATKNEFDLAEKMGDRYKFCFVSLHHESSSYALVTLEELKKLVKTQRIQYQINIKARAD